MRIKPWISIAAAVALLSGVALSLDHGHGKHHDDDDDQDRGRYYYSDHDRDEVERWYRDSDGHLPPGLAKRDDLPPGLEKQLRVRGTLPPGWCSISFTWSARLGARSCEEWGRTEQL